MEQVKIVGPLHYRLREVLDLDGLFIKVEVFTPIKETPRGYWVISEYAPRWLSPDELRKRKFAKWVSKDSIKRKCYPELKDAIKSFRRRKECQASRLRLQLEQAELAVEKFAEYENATVNDFRQGVNVGEIPSASGLVWDY